MKKSLLILASTAAIGLSYAADLNTDDEKASYIIGTEIGGTLANVNTTMDLNRDNLLAGISDVLDGKDIQLEPEEMQRVMEAFSQKQIEASKKAYEEMISKNTEEGEKLQADFKAEEGVTTTDSGLMYKVVTEGKGDKPAETDTVRVNYEGTFADGTVFDSSYEAGNPVEFPLKGVIPGWTEGLQLMPVGSTYEFVIPANLAYGDRAPGQIGPNRTLKFKVELLDIVKPETNAEAAAE